MTTLAARALPAAAFPCTLGVWGWWHLGNRSAEALGLGRPCPLGGQEGSPDQGFPPSLAMALGQQNFQLTCPVCPAGPFLAPIQASRCSTKATSPGSSLGWPKGSFGITVQDVI